MSFGQWNNQVTNDPAGFQGNQPFGNRPTSFGLNPTPSPGFSGSFAPTAFNSNFSNQSKPFNTNSTSFNQPPVTFSQPTTSWGGAPSPFMNSNQPNNFTGGNSSFTAPNQGFMGNNTANPPPVMGNTGFGQAPTNFSGGFMTNSGISNPTVSGFPTSTGFNANPGFANNPAPAFGGNMWNTPNNPGPFTSNSTNFSANNNPMPSFGNPNSFTSNNTVFGQNPASNTNFSTSNVFSGNSFGNKPNIGFSNNPGLGSNGNIRFKALSFKEDTNTINIQNICGMAESQGRSLEELRLSDYKSKTAPVSFNSAISQPLNSGLTTQPSLFSNTNSLANTSMNSIFNKPQDPKPASSLFNTSTPSLFSSNSLFPATSNSSLFSNTNQPTSTNLNPPNNSSLFNTSSNFFNSNNTPSTGLANNSTSLFNNPQPNSLFTASNPSSLFQPKPQMNTMSTMNTMNNNPVQPQDYIVNAFKDPHGLSWLFPERVPENVAKSYNQRISTQISADSSSLVERIVKPKRVSNYPQVLTEK